MNKRISINLVAIAVVASSAVQAGLIKTNSISPTTINEGQSVSVTYGLRTTFGDHFSSGWFSYSLGNGSGLPGGAVSHGATNKVQTRSATYYQDGIFRTRMNGNVRVHNSNHSTDSSSGSFSQYGPTVRVVNVAPTISLFRINGAVGGLGQFVNVSEGQSVTAFMRATDPGLLDDLRFVVNTTPSTAGVSSFEIGTDIDNEFTRQVGSSIGGFAQTGTGYDVYTLRGEVFDDDTSTMSGSIQLRVHNRNPMIQAMTSNTTVLLGENFSFGAFANDPGNDLLTYRWDLDSDGAYDDFFGTSTSRMFGLGAHQLRLQVSDGDGGFAFGGLTLNVVEPLPPSVPEPSAFVLLGMSGLALLGNRWRKKTRTSDLS